MTEKLIFRQLNDSEEAAGYQLICDTVVWLKSKGIKLWEKPLPRDIYALRQKLKENFGLFVDGQMASILSIVRGSPECWWADFKQMEDCTSSYPSAEGSNQRVKRNGSSPSSPNDVMWLCTLTTANSFRGWHIGRMTIEHALAFLAEQNETAAYLDCTPGFLMSFYEELGFKALIGREFQVPAIPSKTVKVVLMKRII